MTAAQVDGDATINGVNTMRVGKLIAGVPCFDFTPTERQIAEAVTKRIEKLHAKGYAMKETAAFARREVYKMALALG